MPLPPSIREAALGMGASKIQMVTHHVLPLAMPGVMTGAILSMAGPVTGLEPAAGGLAEARAA